MNNINHTRLANGVQFISRSIAGARSAALGVWIVNGGRHQRVDQCGYAHLLEHLLFKGTRRHSALALAQCFESLGGQVNAHTGRELTALYGVVPGTTVEQLLELFSAMLIEPAFTAEDIALEREVVFQEMAMIEDTPEEALADAGVQGAWPDHAAGWPILGTESVLQNSTAQSLHAYLRDLLCGMRLYVVAVGAVEHEILVQAGASLAGLPAGVAPVSSAPQFVAGNGVSRRHLSQANLLWVLPAPALGAATHTTALLANHLLGGGASSRLFQDIREQRGLVYGISSRLEQYSDCGLWLIQTACDDQRAAQCRAAVEQVLTTLIETGPDIAELEQSRRHMHAALLIDEDNAEATMERLAREAIYLQRHPTLEERTQQLAAATVEDVRSLLAQSWRDRHYLEWLPD